MNKPVKIVRALLAALISMTFIFTCGCSIRRSSNADRGKTVQTVSDERVSQYIPNSKIDIGISVSGDDPLFTNDDIDSIDIMRSQEDNSYYLRFNLSEIGMARVNSKNINIEDKALTVTANGAEALEPPVFGEIKENCLVISGVGSLENAQDAAMIMTSYEFNLAIKDGYATQEEYEESLVVKENEYEEDEDEDDEYYVPDVPEAPAPAPKPTPAPPVTDEQVIYRVRKSANDAASQIGAFNYLDNAVRLANQRSSEGYEVYDQYGNLIYAP